MPANWKLYRIICILQMIFATCALFATLPEFFSNISFSSLTRLLTFLLAMLLAIFAVNLLNNNYPATPVTDRPKRTFNRLFLLNFIFLAFLFGIVFAEIREAGRIARLTGVPLLQLPFGWLVNPLWYTLILVLQFAVLGGLFSLRRLLYSNFAKQEFEFEK